MLGVDVAFSQVVEKCHEPVCAARPSPGADKVGGGGGGGGGGCSL